MSECLWVGWCFLSVLVCLCYAVVICWFVVSFFPVLLFLVSLLSVFWVFGGVGLVSAAERPSWDSFFAEYAGFGVGYRVGTRFVLDVSAGLQGGGW